MATRKNLPPKNLEITDRDISELRKLSNIIRYTIKDKYAASNLKKIANIPSSKLDELLKKVNVSVKDDGTTSVGRFSYTPDTAGPVDQGELTGEILSIQPVITRAGKTRRRRKKSKGTRRR
jgi:hypothetical protein